MITDNSSPKMSNLPNFTSPLSRKRWFWRGSGSRGEDDFPLLFGIIEQAVEVNVIHERNSDHSSKSREAPLTF